MVLSTTLVQSLKTRITHSRAGKVRSFYLMTLSKLTFHSDMDYNDLNQISKARWGQFGIRREDCAALDKLQEAFDWYNWGITNGDEDSMVENSQ